jgi:radical SAM superfamily enzyme YgiQ (UPF0313 family)
MYRDKKFRVRRLDDVLEDVRAARDHYGLGVRRAFLCDGDALMLPNRHLEPVLEALSDAFPELQRVGIYANARDLLNKSEAELERLVARKMSIFYLGLESGSDRILEWIDKGATSEDMVAAVRKGMAAGMKSSVIYLLGLGGRKLWRESAMESARAVSEMTPNYLSALTVTVIPGTPLSDAMEAGEYELPSPEELVRELRVFLEHTAVRATVFRSNHASNYVPLAGRLPRDKDRLLAELDAAVAQHRFKPEYMRGL